MPAAADFGGRVAFITGGASGIATVLARQGMRTAIADIDPATLAAAEQALRMVGAETLAVTLDVRDREGWSRAVDQATATLGPIHILCNNAGVTIYDPLAEMPAANWDWIVGVNLTGVFNGISAAVPGMIAAGAGGHVVNTASTAGLHPIRDSPIGAYAATKGAAVSLSEALRPELAPHGIGVSALCPGLVGTSSAGLRPVPAVRERPASLVGTARVGAASPNEVGERVLAGIRRDESFIITRPDVRPAIELRYAALLDHFQEPAHAAPDIGHERA